MIEMINCYMKEYLDGNNKIKLLFFIILSIIYYFFEVFGIITIFNQLSNINKNNIKQFFIYVIVFFIVFSLFSFYKNKFETSIQSNNLSKNRIFYINSLYDYIYENYKDMKIGNTITRIFTITSQWNELFGLFFNSLLPTIIILTFVSGYIFYLNKNYGLIIYLCLICTLFIILLFSPNVIKSSIIQNEEYYKNYDKINNQLVNSLNILINNQEKNEKKINYYNWDNYKKKDAFNKTSISNLKLYLIINLSIFLPLILYYILKDNNFNLNNYKNKSILILCLLYFSVNYLKINGVIGDFLRNYSKCYNNIKFFNEITIKNNKKYIKTINNFDIKTVNLNFKYNNTYIFKNLNINIQNKKKTAIIGRSGYGKSTLCKLLLKLYNYDGKILINNIDIQKIDTNYLRSKIIYINQKTDMIESSIINNMNYGNNINNQKIIDLLNKYDLQIIFNRLKNGINENVNLNGTNLSLGMQKIVILIRGILKVNKGEIIIFDEPIAGLDNNTRKKVIKMINNEIKNKTLIVITHDKEILPYMDKVINIEKYK